MGSEMCIRDRVKSLMMTLGFIPHSFAPHFRSPKPISASSDAANRSRVCLCHHAVDSGMSDGIAVPKSLVTGSGSSAADAVFFLNSRLFEFLKKSSAWINRERYQNPVDRQNPAPPRTKSLPPSSPAFNIGALQILEHVGPHLFIYERIKLNTKRRERDRVHLEIGAGFCRSTVPMMKSGETNSEYL